MKSRITKYILIITTIFSMSACADYLDRQPDDMLTLEMVFNDKTRTEDWLAGIYKGIPRGFLPEIKSLEAYADDVMPSIRWEPYSGWAVLTQIQGNWNTNSSWASNYWADLPRRIRSAYIFLEYVKPNESKMFSPYEVKIMRAECRALIAYYYAIMATYYGGVPLQTWLSDFDTPIDELMIGQDPFDKIVDWVANELDEAAKDLPPFYNEANKYGRFTSVMAMAVKARLLTFAASPLTNGNPDYAEYKNYKGELIFDPEFKMSKWERAAKANKDLIDYAHANGYGLFYEYNADGTIDPFLSYQNVMFKKYSEGNKEILFARPADENKSGYHFHRRDMYKYATPRGSGGNGGLGVTQHLVDAFFMKNGLSPILGYNSDGSPIINPDSEYTERGFSTAIEYRKTRWIESKGDPLKDTNPVTLAGTFNMYCNREPRFYVSVLYNGAWYRQDGTTGRETEFYSNKKDGGPTHDAPQNGYLMRKRIHPDYNAKASGNPPYAPAILYRLAEVYLSYAEALNEWKPEEKDEIIKYVNLIRERAGIPVYGTGVDDIPIPASQAEMAIAIRKERRVELNCEHSIRLDDVRRWKIGETELDRQEWGMNFKGTKKSDDPNDAAAYFVRTPYFKRVFQKKNNFWPIHQNQIDKNPNLVQMPFWK